MTAEKSLVTCVSAYQDDIEAYYEGVRSLGGPTGIAWDPATEAWIVTSYELCDTLLRSPQLRRQRVALPRDRHPDLVECAEGILNRQLMFSDSSTAHRLYWSKKLSDAFAGNGSAGFRDIAEQCLNDAGLAPLELYAGVLQPFASRVASVGVGLSEADRRRLYPLIVQCVRFFDGKLRSDRDFDAAMFSIVSLYDRLNGLFRAEAVASSDPLENWTSNLLLSLVAGHESTAYLLGTVFLNVDATLPERHIHRAVHESLRFDSPVQMIGRRAEAPMEVGDARILAGAKLYLHVGAANRDPNVFSSANVFQLGRAGPPALSFGLGEEQCLGRSIAIRSAHAFLGLLVQRAEWFAVNGTVERASGLSGRGFRSLPARLVSSQLTTEGPASAREAS